MVEETALADAGALCDRGQGEALGPLVAEQALRRVKQVISSHSGYCTVWTVQFAIRGVASPRARLGLVGCGQIGRGRGNRVS
ncbi:hypothetical protein Misp02_65300 [Microtetraspora sp. NBRC 16547]|nr:hypothetical protein Misp02_65300 [Microtetraspora sp. NBRC 16547]